MGGVARDGLGVLCGILLCLVLSQIEGIAQAIADIGDPLADSLAGGRGATLDRVYQVVEPAPLRLTLGGFFRIRGLAAGYLCFLILGVLFSRDARARGQAVRLGSLSCDGIQHIGVSCEILHMRRPLSALS